MIYTVTLNPALDKELVVPELALDTVLRSEEVRLDFGGKGFNVSRMLAALGTPSVALAFAGGHNGRLLHDGLAALGIATNFVWVDEETRTNVSIVTAGPGGHTIKVNEPGPAISAAAQEALQEKVRACAAPGDWWVLAGSLPPGVAPSFYARLIEDIQGAGGRVLLDTSGAALREGSRARPFLIKPNALELAQLSGLPVDTPQQAAAAARAVQQAGPANVVVSLGQAGALLVTEQSIQQAAAPQIAERNPIGAGDALVGGLVRGLAEGLPLAEALRWGVACGAAAASMSGTAVGSPEVVERLLAQVRLTEVSP